MIYATFEFTLGGQLDTGTSSSSRIACVIALHLMVSAYANKQQRSATNSTAIASYVPYLIVGMTNSAPERMPVGQREVTVFSWV